MGDFLLSVGQTFSHDQNEACAFLRFFDEMRVIHVAHEALWLCVTTDDDSDLWKPCHGGDGKSFVALVGHVVFEPEVWEAARSMPGVGGLACKAIYQSYQRLGVDALGQLDGNYVVVVFDAGSKKLHIVTDRCGVFPCFRMAVPGGGVLYGSHPDALALLAGDTQDWDLTSLTEFLIYGRLTPPYTYYQRLRSIDGATAITLDLSDVPNVNESVRRYAKFDFAISRDLNMNDLALSLAEAVQRSVRRRVNPILGRSALALSGGLDSRVLACSLPDREGVFAFCMFDTENLEYQLAKAIAQASGIEFIGMQRDPEHYVSNASMAVRISGGMGAIINNHFLGFREKLRSLGATRLMTGCYCDYLLKGLLMDKQTNRFTRVQRLGPYASARYHPIFGFNTKWGNMAAERTRNRIPAEMREDVSEIGRLRVEQQRIMPLCYEGDNVMRNTILRTMGAIFPFTGQDVINAYLTIAPGYKLNNLLFGKAVQLVCSREIRNIPNSNTGASLEAPLWCQVLSCWRLGMRRRVFEYCHRVTADDSWPNWNALFHRSQSLRDLWLEKDPPAFDLFRQLLGSQSFLIEPSAYAGSKVELFYRLLTLKLWIKQRNS